MKKNINVLLIIIAVINMVFSTSCIQNQNKKIEFLEKNIAHLKEENIPIRFKILEKTDDTISFVVKFYDADNNEINKFEQKLYGEELSFDFYVVPINEHYVAFPSKIFTDKIAADNGIILYNYYNTDGYPVIFNSKDINPKLYGGLKDVFTKIQNNQLDSLSDYFGNMVHDIKEIKSFLPQNVYSITTHTKGGIEIIEE